MAGMTIRDLREQLAALPDDTPVFVDGYEGGVETPRPVQVVDVALNVHSVSHWWYGPHEPMDEYYDDGSHGDRASVKAVVLARGGDR